MVGDAESEIVKELAAAPFGAELVGVLFFVLLGLLGVALCWALVLGAARWARERIGHGPEAHMRRPALSWESEGLAPLSAKGERAEPLLSGSDDGQSQARTECVPAPSLVKEKQPPAARMPAEPKAALPIRHVQMAELPRLEPMETVLRARSEKPGEVARLSIRHELPGKHRSLARRVEYRIAALPWADSGGGGQQRPAMLVYTVSEESAAPKRGASPFRFKG